MTTQIQRRRGTDTQHGSFTGAEGELSVNTTNKSVHVHDGATAGGFEAARADLGNVSDADLNSALTGNTLSSLTITSADINGGTIDGTVIGGATPAAGSFTTLSASTSITGTLATAAQTNITSVGTLTGLTVSGSTSLAGASTSADITFGDNDKAIFGAGSDLQIYSDGNTSFIKEGGSGNFAIDGTNIFVRNGAGTANMAAFVDGGAATLYHNSSAKLATTSTGIDVTGAVTADGLVVDTATQVTLGAAGVTNGVINCPEGLYINIDSDNNQADTREFRLGKNGTGFVSSLLLQVAENGDVRFYEDTGTTPKFFWDASAEALALGTATSVSNNRLVIDQASGDGQNSGFYMQRNGGAGTSFKIDIDSSDVVNLRRSATTALAIDSSGNVGIGTSSPATALDVAGTITADGLTVSTTSAVTASFSRDGSDGDSVQIFNGPVGTTKALGLGVDGTHGTINSQFGGIKIQPAGPTSAFFGTGGDISFYEDTGTTPKFFWDASAESLLIGSDSGDVFNAASTLRLQNTNSTNYIQMKGTTTSTLGLLFGDTDDDFVGGLQYSHTDDELLITTNNSERMRIDSSGNVGIGTSSPAFSAGSGLRIERDATATLRLQDTGAHGFEIRATSTAAEFYSANAKPFTFETGGSERMRIDSSGNLLVGTTDTYPVDDTAGNGISFRGGTGDILAQASSRAVIDLNRTTSDGVIANFRKDGTTVGSIGVASSNNLYIGATAANHAGVYFGTNIVYPMTAGSISDGAVNLGEPTAGRFKDLYLSGGVYLGGTGSANKLDDYEEGTWTPTLWDNPTGGTQASSYGFQGGYYTKIGRLVTIIVELYRPVVTGLSGALYVRNLPFSITSQGGTIRTFNVAQVIGNASGSQIVAQTQDNTGYISLVKAPAWSLLQSSDVNGTTSEFRFSLSYYHD